MNKQKMNFSKRDLKELNNKIQNGIVGVLPDEICAMIGEIKSMTISAWVLDDGKVHLKIFMGMDTDSEELKEMLQD